MAKKFVVEDVRVTSWSLRLRDPDSGESFDVPVNPGARFAPPKGRDAGEEERRAAKEKEPAEPTEKRDAPATSTDGRRPARKTSTAQAAASKTKPKRSTPATDPSSPWAPGKPNPLETHEGRGMPVDEKSLTDADRKVIEDHQKFWTHVHDVKTQKRGKLGWEETTDAGRSGLRARHKSGAYKILHAGGDIYALFYEWDSGKFVKLGCGKADDMMNLADEQSREKLQPPPRTLLDLEIARHMCSSDPQQRQIAAERLEPVFREGLRLEDDQVRELDTPPPPTKRRSQRRAAPPPASPSEPHTTTAPPPSPPARDVGVDAQRDETLKATFAQALAEMEDE